MTGYHPDYSFLESVLRIAIGDDAGPHAGVRRGHLRDQPPWRLPGRYGVRRLPTGRWFIENGRFHAQQIARHIAHGSRVRVPFERIHWKTEE